MNEPGSQDFWDDLLGHLKERVLVTVVGPDAVTVGEGPQRKTLSRALGERLAEKYALPVDWSRSTGLGDVVHSYFVTKGPGEAERLYRVVNDLLARVETPHGEALGHLAAITDLRLFVSTTFDGLLARAIDAARSGGVKQTRELWFSPNQSTADQQRNAIPPASDEVVVFKLFGQASSMPQYALHDEDVLEWLHAVVSEAARLPDWLTHELRENPLLFLGCQIPDWLSRFFLRLGSRTRLSLAQKQFFLVGNGISEQTTLPDFLRTYCGTTRVQLLDADPGEFAAELEKRWRERTPALEHPAAAGTNGGRGDIFISYAREDVEAARRLHASLTAIGGDVWLDERRLLPGDRWQDEILAGIRRGIRLFVPLVSRHTESRSEGYVFREWREAVERSKSVMNRRFIVPLAVDPDYDGHPERLEQLPEEFRQLDFGRAPGGVPSEALLAAFTQDIRALRRPAAA